ncbi:MULTISPECIES: hypothetical protein [Falsihalocynthiibacter]|uniref:hypothetical protein n=1 Tax=Falsihalocynthiibacter TaxID=2854182 RepID=UPI003001A277
MGLRAPLAHWVVPVAFAAGLSLVAGSAPAAPLTAQEAAATAISRCAALPEVKLLYSTTLLDEGWQRVENTKTLPDILTASNLIATLDPAATKASVQTAQFLTMSVLGGSNLAPNQPVYQHGDVFFAPLGLETKKPWCVLAGPSWLAILAEETLTQTLVPWTGLPDVPSRHLLREATERSRILLSEIDVQTVTDLLTPIEETDGAPAKTPALYAVNITITTTPMSLGKLSE